MADDLTKNPPKTPQTPDVIVKEEPDETETPAIETTPQEPDLTAMQKKIEGSVTDKVSKTLLEKIGGALGLTKDEEEKLPTDPKELQKFVQDNAKRIVQETLTEREVQEQMQSEERQKQVTEGAQRFQSLWKSQYEELATQGRVPKIQNPNDANDPGNVAKVRLLTKIKEIIDENQKKGVDYVPTLKEVYYENPDVLRSETTAGAHTPISGGGRSTTPNNGLTYEQLHKNDFDDIVRNKYD